MDWSFNYYYNDSLIIMLILNDFRNLEKTILEIIDSKFNTYFTIRQLSLELLSKIEDIPLRKLSPHISPKNEKLLHQIRSRIVRILYAFKKRGIIKKYSKRSWQKLES